MRSATSGEMIFNLPMSESKKFPALFETLEREKPQLDFLNLGLSVTSMEDVFLRLLLSNVFSSIQVALFSTA